MKALIGEGSGQDDDRDVGLDDRYAPDGVRIAGGIAPRLNQPPLGLRGLIDRSLFP